MKSALVFLSGLVGSAVAQGVTSELTPPGSTPEGCSADYSGNFEITVVRVVGASKRDLGIQKRDACGGDGILVLDLASGVLKDAQGRVGYIASNRQFQFDGPPQAGAIYTAGYSVCSNGSLALGPSTTFYECLSGTFYNLYDQTQGGQCSPVQLVAIPCGGADPPGEAGEGNDGQAIATEVVTTTIVKPISDGQPQVITTVIPVPICQISDGQVQGVTTPCASLPVAATTTAAPVSQYSDGQIQVTGPPAPVVSTTPASTTTTPAPAPVSSSSTTTTPAPAPTTSATTTTTPAPAPVIVSSSSSVTPLKNSTLSTSLSPTAPSSSKSSSTPTPSTAPTSGAARHMEMASISALVVGLVGAVLFL